MLGISCTSVLLVSVFGAVVDDPLRHRLPIQVTDLEMSMLIDLTLCFWL